MAVKVVDASALAALLFDEPEAGAIAARLDGEHLAAPALLGFELANVCLVKSRRHPEQRDALSAAFRLREKLQVATATIDHDGVLELAHATGLTVDFLAPTGQLTIANPSVFQATIAHWGASDRIDLANVVSNGFTFANNTLTVLESGQPVAALHFAGAYTQSDFMVTTDNVGGTAITFT